MPKYTSEFKHALKQKHYGKIIQSFNYGEIVKTTLWLLSLIFVLLVGAVADKIFFQEYIIFLEYVLLFLYRIVHQKT